ncbi:hypothetical protein NXC24_PB00068 (plasmid) [Rhizobium sp. NXC24]|nr:hypothetical protein NXC24_PB00068 [Rhizobium sp. NXC24]
MSGSSHVEFPALDRIGKSPYDMWSANMLKLSQTTNTFDRATTGIFAVDNADGLST